MERRRPETCRITTRAVRLRASLGLLLALALVATGPALAQGETGTVTGTVKDAGTSRALAGATVLVVEVQRSARTDAGGSYMLRLPPGRYKLLVARTGYETVQREVMVSAGRTATFDFELSPTLADFGEEIVVLGSRSARTALETPVPVDVLSQEEIVQTGQSETSRVIQFLAPSFNFSTSTISDGTDIVRPSTLRGLGPDQTLVLVNGKRRHNSALVHVNGSIGRGTSGVDINAIPSSAIEKIEVLRDGAAAQYGSDAIAGVLNLQLKEQTDVTQIELTAGETYVGDGDVAQLSVNHGWQIRDTGFINVTGEYRDRGATNRAGEDPRRQFNFLEQVPGEPALSTGTEDPREATFNRLTHRYGDPDSENLYLFVNSSIPISDTTNFYAFGGFSDRDGESGGFYRRATDARTVLAIHSEGFLPLINTTVEDYSLAVGVRKVFSRWALDASVTNGGNSFEFDIANSNNVTLGAASPMSADAGTLSFYQSTINFNVFGTLDWGLEAPVSLAFGAEFRQDNYEIEAGELASYDDGGEPNQFGEQGAPGIQVFPGFRPSNEVDVDRDNVAVYADLELYPAEKLLLGLAARYEDYSDFGNQVSGKLALRYAFTDKFALRGSASTGFRAPSLHQAFFNNTSTQFVLNETTGELEPFEVGTFANDSAVVQGFGVPALKEETSVGGSLGFTARPLPNMSITADAFRIDIDDRIVISGTFQAEPDPDGDCVAMGTCPIRAILEPLGVNAGQFFANAIDTETNGLDVVVAYVKRLNADTSLSLTVAGKWNDTEVVGEVQTPAPLAGLGETIFNRIERERVETAQPKQLYNIATNYREGGFSALLRFNKFGAVKQVESASDPSIDQVFSSKWLTDIDLSYTFANGIRWALGGNNVFDVYPDEQSAATNFNGIFPYPRRTAPFGFNGGYYYTRLTFEF